MPGVTGNWFADIQIDGNSLPINANLLSELTVRSNVNTNLPSFQFSLIDPAGKMHDDNPISDGTPIVITMGDGKGGQQTMNFTAIGGPQNLITYSGGLTYTIAGLLDHINYQRKIIDQPTKGTSTDVMEKLAGLAGLAFDGDKTDDKQVWLPNRTPLVQYARFVAEHGYASQTSCMLSAVTEMGKLLYKDLDKIIQSGAQKVFSVNPSTGDVPVLQTQVTSKGGTYNNQRAYGSTTFGEELTGKLREFNKIDITRLSNVMGVGQRIVDSIGDLGGRIDPKIMDSSNVHKKWLEAFHQNRRTKSFWAEDLQVLTDVFSDTSLLQLVEYKPEPAVQGAAKMAQYAGDFLVTAKVMTIKQGRYWEKLVLTTQGPQSGAGAV